MADIELLLKVNTSSGEVRLGAVADKLDVVSAKGVAAQRGIDSFGDAMRQVGGGALAGFTAGLTAMTTAVGIATASVLKFTDTTGRLADLSAKSGIAADSLQRLGYAAKLVGADQDQVAQATVKLGKAIVDGNQAFAQLGLNVGRLRDLKPEQQFAEVAQAVNRLGTDTEKSAAAMDIFGKSGAELLPLLKSNLSSAADEAQRLGLVLDNETVAAGDKLGDSFDNGKLALANLGVQFGAAIATTGGFQQAVDDAVRALADLGKWVTEHKDEIHGLTSLMVLGFQGAAQAARELVGWVAKIPGAGDIGSWLKAQGQGAALVDAAAHGGTGTGLSTSAGIEGANGPAAYVGASARAAIEAARKANDEINDLFRKGTLAFFDEQAKKLDAFREKVNVLDDYLKGSTGLFGAKGGDFGSLGIQTVTDAEMKAAVDAINRGWSEGERRTNEAKQKLYEAGKAWHVSWAEGMSALAAGFEALGGRIGSILGGIMRDLLGIGQAMKSLNFKGGITGGAGLGGLLSNIGGVLSIAGAGFSILKGIGGLFGIGKHKEPPPPPPTWEEKWKQAIEDVDKFALVGSRDIRALLDASGPAGHRKAEAQQYVNEQLGRSTSAMGAIGGLDITSQASAQAQATIFTTTFWATVKEQGLVKGVDALAAPFAALKEKLAAGGFDVNALLGSVGGLFDAVEGPARSALEAMDALNQSLQGVANAGYLTRDSFAAYGVAAGDAFQQARDAGLDQNQALQAIAPLLGSIISASDQYGFAIDENTQALIDQAKAAGIAFPEDPMERAAKAMEKLVEHLERIYGLSEDIGTSFNNMQVPAVPGSGGGPHAQGYSPEGYAGGFSTYSMPPGPLPGGGTPVVLHPREQVSVIPAGRRSPGGFTGGIGSIQVAAGAISVQGGDPQRTAVAVLEKIADGAADEIILRRIGWRVRGKL